MKAPPFDDRDGFIWMDGQMVPWREANVHFLTHGLHYGTTVFEGERAYSGQIFKSKQHTQRLLNSAEMIYMPMNYTLEQIEAAKKEVLKANNLENAYIRACAWRGTQMGVDTQGVETRMAIAAWGWDNLMGQETRDKGIALQTSRYTKPTQETAPIHSKCSSLYALSTMAKHVARQAGYDDVVMHDFEGYVAECSAANFFMVRDGVLMTPIADRFLNGITRQSIIEIANTISIPVEERRIKPEELIGIDEAFVTGSAMEITPVNKIDNQILNIGPLYKKLAQSFTELVHTKT